MLFVCLGNICRSPTATAVFRARARAAGLYVQSDGAGTGAWHIGQSPDSRASREAAARGYDMTELRARQVTSADFHEYDLILAMDRSNLSALEAIRPQTASGKLALFLGYAADQPLKDVPDPYYDGDFKGVLDLIEQTCDQLVVAIKKGVV